MPKNNKDIEFLNNDEKANLNAVKSSVKDSVDIFKCPVCGDKMYMFNSKSVLCLNKHCFDISKKGYVNLLLRPGKMKYNREMFEARNLICKIGFFDPLIDLIVSSIVNNVSDKDIRILDAGCGEGYNLSRIVKVLEKKLGSYILGVGIDISKEGIKIASKEDKDAVWCVADLAKIPFLDAKFDIILNILSPSNYGEFDRLITRDGLLIKVVPGSDYLKELRKAFYGESNRQVYSNDRVIEHFSKNFKMIDIQNIRYDIELSKEDLGHLIKMTPLSWGVDTEKTEEVVDKNIETVTADFTIMIGKRK